MPQNNVDEEKYREALRAELAKLYATMHAGTIKPQNSDELLKQLLNGSMEKKFKTRLIAIPDEDNDGILKLSLLPDTNATNDQKASQVVEFRFHLPNAYTVAKTRHFQDKRESIQETALRIIHEKCSILKDTTKYKTAIKELIALDKKCKEEIDKNASIDKEKMKGADKIYGSRYDENVKKYFKSRHKNGVAALQEYSYAVSNLLTEATKPSETTKASEEINLKEEATIDASKKRPVFINFSVIEDYITAETHEPQQIAQMHASSSVMEDGIHNHLKSKQEIFKKDGEYIEAHEITRSSVITSIGAIKLPLFFEGTPNLMPVHNEINPTAIKKRNKFTFFGTGRQENLFLFKQLANDNMADLLEKEAASNTSLKDNGELSYCLQTILSPLPAGPLNFIGKYSRNPDRSMVEACAAAVYRQEGLIINIGGKNIIKKPFYLNIGVNIFRGNGGELEKGINARGFNNLLDLVLKKTNTTSSELDFDPEDKTKIDELTNEKIKLYKKQDSILSENLNERSVTEEYYTSQKRIDVIEKEITALHLKRAEKIKKNLSDQKNTLLNSATDENKVILDELFQLHTHMTNNYNYTKLQKPKKLSASPLWLLGNIGIIAVTIIASPFILLSGIFYPKTFINNTIETIQAAQTFLNRTLGFYSNDANYCGPMLISSITDKLKVPYHFTCKSGEDRTGFLDNMRKAYNIIKKQITDFNIANDDRIKELEKVAEHISNESAGTQTNGANSKGADALQVSSKDINGKIDYKILNDIAKLASSAYAKPGFFKRLSLKLFGEKETDASKVSGDEIKNYKDKGELIVKARAGDVAAQKALYILQNPKQITKESVSIIKPLDAEPAVTNGKMRMSFSSATTSTPAHHGSKSEIIATRILPNLTDFLTKFTKKSNGNITTTNNIHNLKINSFNFTVEEKVSETTKMFPENTTCFSFKPTIKDEDNKAAYDILGEMVGSFKEELNKNKTDKKELKAFLTVSGPNPEKMLTLLYIQCRQQGFEDSQIQLKQPPVIQLEDFKKLKRKTPVPLLTSITQPNSHKPKPKPGTPTGQEE
jgi:hypothetical protein